MRIDFVEIRNFRRLAAIKIDFSKETTLFVGANNSGKTSAIHALRYFLVQQKAFSVHDIPLAHWARIDKLGEGFEKSENGEPPEYKWTDLLPSLDVWLKISEGEVHRVAHLIPTLDWKADQGIGVRLQLEPKKSDELLKSFLKAKKAACDTLCACEPDNATSAEKVTGQAKADGSCRTFALWPESLMAFLKKHMSSFLTVKHYLLDPSKKATSNCGAIRPQELPDDVEPLEDNSFKGLIKINEVPAHRDLSDYSGVQGDGEGSDQPERGRKQLLTAQLRAYYSKHLDPLKAPEPSDIQALRAIYEAETIFDERLKDRFKTPLDELEQLGYPGVANPRLVIATSIKPEEGLRHQSAVQYEVVPTDGKNAAPCRLPEQCNGLGYQNLISMVFRLISFRDDWMKVGKAARIDEETGARQDSPEPLHLVLLEEPEAHLHVQVQQVFIRKAYEVLRGSALEGGSPLSTQLVVSTHSGHIAHEVDFADMRYFRRLPACNSGQTPTSTVVNLSEVFGTPHETERFVSRYLQATHADLFFADGAILVEGAAERMLVPHFIRNHYEKLRSCYVTLLEVGGSHAHRLKQLIKHLGLNTLIITDIDALDKSRTKALPNRGTGLITGNNVLKEWHPRKDQLDELLDLSEEKKEKPYDNFFSIRVAYQIPVQVALKENDHTSEGLPSTFEDALVFENIELFRQAEGAGLLKRFKDAILSNNSVSDVGHALFEALKSGTKAEFALDMLYCNDPKSIRVPEYIHNGLKWLETKLVERQQEILVTDCQNEEAPDKGAR
jgi:predicted ATP-dependent endonuclease of OLD family